MERTQFTQELEDLKLKSRNVINSINEYAQKYQERNTSRQILIEDLRELLPDDQFQRFNTLLNETLEEGQPIEEPTPYNVEIDPEDPLTSLRQARDAIMEQIGSPEI